MLCVEASLIATTKATATNRHKMPSLLRRSLRCGYRACAASFSGRGVYNVPQQNATPLLFNDANYRGEQQVRRSRKTMARAASSSSTLDADREEGHEGEDDRELSMRSV